MPISKKIMVAICKWEDISAVTEWIPLYEPIPCDCGSINYDAYGRKAGEPYFQCPREPQKQIIDSGIRYYCFEDYGEETLVYKEITI
jgi:hypothetical protein